MKLQGRFIIGALVGAIGGFGMSTANAATKLNGLTVFTPSAPTSILKVRAKSWRDPAFGNLGWVHHSSWGTFSVAKAKLVTIKAVSKVAGLHPGLTVWSRGKADVAPNMYVNDHMYTQNTNIVEFAARDETANIPLGNIVMQVVAYGYDQDGNTEKASFLKGVKDNIPGQLTLKFMALPGVDYQFVLGGFNPDASFSAGLTMKHAVEVTVSGQ